MKKKLLILISIMAIAGITLGGIYYFSVGKKERLRYNPGIVLVQFKEGTSNEEIQRIVSSVGAKIEKKIETFGIYILKFSKSQSVPETLDRLRAFDSVVAADPDVLIPVRLTAAEQFNNLLLKPEDRPTLKYETIVAVLDTGVDINHEALKPYLVGGYDFYQHDSDPSPSNNYLSWHGTAVAGRVIEGAGGSNIKIMPIRVGPGPWLPLSSVLEGLDYAAKSGAKVVNMSFGTWYNFSTFEAAIKKANSLGMTLIASAGNTGTDAPHYPAAYDSVIGIGATDSNMKMTWWSSYGKNLDFVAEGLNTYTTMPGNRYGYLSGTSASAPFVAGLAAMILGENPNLTPAQVLERLQALARNVSDINRRNTGGGFLGYEEVRQLAQQILKGEIQLPSTAADWLIKTEKLGKEYILRTDGTIEVKEK